MRRIVTVIDKTKKGKVKIIHGETKVRDLSHLDAQIRFPAQVQKPKKGKGSYTRKSKYKDEY